MPEPKRVRVTMPDGNNYMFPEGTTSDEILNFTQEKFGYMLPVPSHGDEPEIEPSAMGEEDGRTVPAHAPTLTMEEKARQLEGVSPARTAETLYAQGAVTPMDRATSGVAPAPPATIGDPTPYLKDAAMMVPQEIGKAVSHPIEYAKDLGQVALAPSGGFNLAFGGGEPMTAPREPKMTLRGEWPGMVESGNLDINNRPIAENPDGTTSSVYSMSIGVDDKEYLIPRISEDGRMMSEDEAVATFTQTGNHLGVFDTSENATAYAIALHEQQAALTPIDAAPPFARALERGVGQALSYLPALAGTLLAGFEQTPWVDDQGRPLGEPGQLSKDLFKQSAEIRGRVGEVQPTGARSIFDIETPEQTSEFIMNTFAEQAPIIAGLVGSTLLGGPASVIPAAMGLETGIIAQEMQIRNGEVDPTAALLGGAVAGALEAAPIMLWLKRTGSGDDAMRWIAGRAVSMMAQTGEEVPTEYAQELVEALAVQWLADNKGKITPKEWEDGLEVIKATQKDAVAAAAAAAVIGPVMGATSSTSLSESAIKARKGRAFKKMFRMKERAGRVQQEVESPVPPLGTPGEEIGGPRVPPFEPMEPTEGAQEPPEGPAPAPGPEAEPEPAEVAPEPEGPPPTVRRKGVAPEAPPTERRGTVTDRPFPDSAGEVNGVPLVGDALEAAKEKWDRAPEILRRYSDGRKLFAQGQYELVRLTLTNEDARPYDRPSLTDEEWTELEKSMQQIDQDVNRKWGQYDPSILPAPAAEPEAAPEEGPLDLDLDPDWSTDDLVEYMTNLIDNFELSTEEAQVLDDFLNPDKPDAWKGEDLLEGKNHLRVDELQAKIDEMIGKEPEAPAEPEPEAEEPRAPYRVGQIIWRNRDGMSAEVIRVTPKRDPGGGPSTFMIRLEFYDGHKHSFNQRALERSFSTIPKEEAEAEPTVPPSRDVLGAVSAIFEANATKKGFLFGELLSKYKEVTGEEPNSVQVKAAVDSLLADETIRPVEVKLGGTTTTEFIWNMKKAAPKKPRKKKKPEGPTEKERFAYPPEPSKTGDVVIEGTAAEVEEIRSRGGAPRGDGFTPAQRQWFHAALKDHQKLVDPQEVGPGKYALEVRVPDDGTFFFTAEGAGKMRNTLSGSAKSGPKILRVKYKPPVMGHKDLPYNAAGGWEDAHATEKKGVYTDGHGMILELSPDATARVKKRINDIDPDIPKTPKDSIDRVIETARKSQSVIRVRGLVYPNPHGSQVKGEWGIELETEDGTRVNHFTLSWDKMKFLEEATGFDTMKADLTDDKTFSPVGLYKGRKLVGVLMPAKNTNYRAGEPQPAVEEANDEPTPAEGAKASYGRYRAFYQQNGPNGPLGQGLAVGAPPQLRVLPLGMPELVRLARALGRGRYPRIRRILNRNPGVLGYFRFKPRSQEGITLKASIFAEPEQAAATLAHEIGHWVDYLPERTFARGNILGRIAGLIRYMKKTISMYPDMPGEITPEDRARLRKEARVLSREEYIEEVEEVIRKEFGITVDDVLNIWRQYVPDVPKELHDFIKDMSAAQKISIAKQAMAGLLAPELERFKRVIEEKTGKVRRVKKVRYKDVEKVFRELLLKEIEKRHLVTVEEIRDEMWSLSVAWRPLPAAPSRAHLKYRKGGDEIYADAISALLNDPDFFQRTAPKSYQMMLAYLQKNPAFWDDYQQLQQLAQDPELLNDDRLSEYHKMMARGSVARAQQMKDRLGIGQSWKERRADLGSALASGMIDTNAAWYRLRRKARKDAGLEWLEEHDPIHNIEELAYANARYAYYLDRWQAEVKDVIGDLLSDAEFGTLLGLRRAGRAKKRGGRRELANPMGIGGADARRLISHLLKKKKITTSQAKVVVQALKNWQAIREEIFDEIEDAEMLSTSLLGVLRKSVGSYATFAVRHFIEEPDPATNVALGNIQRQIGTFQEIGNPVIETILKDLALARAAHRTQTIRYMIDRLVETDPDAVMPAFQKRARGIATGFPPPPQGMSLVTYLEKGKVKGVYMNDGYAKSLLHREATATYQYYRVATGLVRGIFVTHNPMWAIWNTQRDFRAMLINTTPGNAITAPFIALKWVLAAAPEAFKDVSRNGPTMRTIASLYKLATGKKMNVEALTVRQMMKESALIQSGMRFYKAADILDEEASALLFQFYGLTEATHQTMVRKTVGHLGAILSNPGQFSERLIKIAGYKMLKKHQDSLKLTDKEVAHLVRTRVGTPDIMRRGDYHNFTNSLFLFSNVAKEGYRAGWESFEEDHVRYASKLITYDVIPTVLKWMASAGLFGPALKGLYDRIPEYHKRTYTVIPLGLTSSGKAVYMIFPHDHIGQLFVSATWAALTRDRSLQNEIMWEVNQNAPWSMGSLHPYVESVAQWSLYSAGINPQDWFRGRSVVPEKVWESEDKSRAHGYMISQTWNNVGGRIMTDFAGLGLEDEHGDVDEQTIADWIQKASGWPVAGSFLKRFLRVSDQGLNEVGFDTLREMRQPKEAATLIRDDLIEEVLKANPVADGWDVYAELLRRDIDPAFQYDSEKELVRKLNTRADTLRLRVHGTTLDRVWSFARNKEEREAIEKIERELEEGEE